MVIDDDFIMPFGEYKGFALRDVPDKYLLQVYNVFKNHKRSLDFDLIFNYIVNNLDAIKKNVEEQRKKFEAE